MKNKNLIRPLSLLFLFFLFSLSTYAQSETVKGVVKSASGEILIGVSVMEVGTSNGTITDLDGNFSIKVSAKSKLKFSYLGYLASVIEVLGKNNINVVLTEDNKALEEVVVVGYGTQRKEAVTGSVASVKGDVMREVPSADISRALQGRIAGVDMEQTSSKPGTPMQIRIRGTRSLNASNDPLIVLDGIPFAGSLSDISPSDIKSIDILKDASSTAIYGSRGANGVILVTSNRGTKGQKAQVTYDGYYGAKTVFGKFPMMNGAEYVKLRAAAGVYPTNSVDESNDTNTDWQDLFYRPAVVTSHDLGISGGTEKGSYKFGIGYYKDQAVLPGQDFNRYSMRASLDQMIGDYIHVGFNTNSNYSITNGSNLGLYNVLSMSPIANPYNADGTWKRTIKMPADEQWNQTRDIVNNLGDKWIDQTKAFGSYNSAFAEVKIPGINGLKYRVNLGLDFRESNLGQYTGMGVFSTNSINPSVATIGTALTTSWAIENLLTYDRTFAKKHQVSAVALYSAEQNSYNSTNISEKNIASDAFQYFNLGRSSEVPTINPDYQGYSVTGLTSYMGRVNYSYDSRYMLMASVRADGSSRLAPGHKWVTYPAASVGWNINKESFMKDITVIDMLKVRVGYGVTSNQAIDAYSTLGLLKSNPMNLGTTNSTGYYVSTLPNPNLGWEISQQMNYALDFSILKNRLSGSIEYYKTDTKNLLLSVSLPPTTGVNSYMANVGQSQNKGWELALNGVILDNLNGWTWDIGANLYTNHNILVALASGATEDKNNNWFVGHPIDVIYDYKAVGKWQAGDANLLKYEPGGNVGMIKVLYTGTYNTDGTPTRAVNSDDRQIMSMEPKFMGGFNTHVAYKGFDLSVVAAFKCGGLLIATPYGSAGYLNILTGRRGQIKADYWTTDNINAMFPKPGGVGGDSPKYLNSLSYMDASYLKIRTISLGYSFDTQRWFKNNVVNKMRLSVTAQNPFVLFSPYYTLSGMDPETNSYGNENASVPMPSNLKRLLTIGTNTPTTRNYLVNLSLTF